MGWSPHHKRMKRRRTHPTNNEARHKGRVKQLPCYGCGRGGTNEAHHTLLRFAGKYARRDHRFLIPLCPDCHRGRYGVHGIGSGARWLERQNKTEDQAIAYAKQLWAESEEIRKARENA